MRHLLFITFLTFSTLAFAGRNGSVVVHQFPVTPHVKKQVWFWEKVFSEYEIHQTLIHDKRNPHLIIDLIDFKVFAKKYKRKKMYTRQEKKKLTKRYLSRYKKALARFKREGRNAIRYGAIEKRVYNVYSKDLKALSALYKGKVELRSQSGLADSFADAAVRANKYLPYMEKIFIREGLSSDLTRIAFVESMFNISAKSKVGASGLWQFMPRTAKSYMRINKYIDERHAPLKATVGAARLLRDNYEALGSWPLAITAYNHGRSGMARAKRILKTSNMDEIIKRYKHRMFGFASSNFYAEFLAARNVYNKIHKRIRTKDKNPLRITTVALEQPISVHAMVKYSGLSEKTIRHLNPDLKKAAFTSYRYMPLPVGYELIIPYGTSRRIKKSLSRAYTAHSKYKKKRYPTRQRRRL